MVGSLFGVGLDAWAGDEPNSGLVALEALRDKTCSCSALDDDAKKTCFEEANKQAEDWGPKHVTGPLPDKETFTKVIDEIVACEPQVVMTLLRGVENAVASEKEAKTQSRALSKLVKVRRRTCGCVRYEEGEERAECLKKAKRLAEEWADKYRLKALKGDAEAVVEIASQIGECSAYVAFALAPEVKE